MQPPCMGGQYSHTVRLSGIEQGSESSVIIDHVEDKLCVAYDEFWGFICSGAHRKSLNHDLSPAEKKYDAENITARCARYVLVSKSAMPDSILLQNRFFKAWDVF
eukprot:2925563-Pleurochrysis_carterae.AAC.2